MAKSQTVSIGNSTPKQEWMDKFRDHPRKFLWKIDEKKVNRIQGLGLAHMLPVGV